MKKSKKISVLISLVLISILAIGAVSAAEDTAVTDDADLAAVDDVQTVDDAPITDEINYESNDIIVTDTGDSGDLDDADTDVISDTGLKGDSDDGDEAVVSDASSPKNALKAEINPDEPLRAPDGTFTQLSNLISNTAAGSTIVLDRNYVYSSGDSTAGVSITKRITIDGNGYTIDGKGQARCFRIESNRNDITIKNLHIINGNAPNTGSYLSPQYLGGAIYHSGGGTFTITNCSFVNNTANTGSTSSQGGVIYQGSGTLNITHSEFYNNSAYNGGVIYQGNSPTVSIKGCAIVNNTATGAGDFSYLASGAESKFNYSENWWGDNYGPGYRTYAARYGAYLAQFDYYIATEILTSPITIEVNMVLDSGNTPTIPLEQRHAIVTNDADTCNTTDGWVPEAFTIEFTTGSDAYINVTIDNQHLVLKVFAGENKKNITELRVVVDNVTLPAQPVAHVYSDVDGEYNLTLGSQVIPVTVTNGEGTYQFSGLNVGQYTVIVSRVDDPVYKTTFNTTDFEVKRYATQLTIDSATPDPVYGQDITIIHELTPNGPTGFITYYVDGSETGTQLGINENFILSDLTAGTHTVVAKYNGDPTYDVSTSNTLTINVAKAPLIFNVTNVTVNFPNKGTVNVTSNVDGNYIVTVATTDYLVTIVDGKGSFEVTENLNVGEYVISWDINHDNYKRVTGTGFYNVTAPAPEFDITGSAEINYGQTNTITHTITEGATGTITYTVNDVNKGTLGLDENLVLENLDAGHYVVVAAYSGGGNYGPTSDTFEFDVLPIDVSVTVSSPEVVYPNRGTILLNASVAGEYIVKVGDKNYTATVETAGTPVEVLVRDYLEAGTYDISVTADLGNNYKPVDTGKIGTYTVTKPAPTLIINVENFIYGEENKWAYIFLKDGENPLRIKNVNVTVDDFKQTVTTQMEGDAGVLLTSLSVGTHNIVAIFEGDENYAPAYAVAEFNITKAEPRIGVYTEAITYGEDAVINVTLDGVKNEKITGVVTLNISGKVYDVAVNNGEGTVTVSGLAVDVEGHVINASFAGNDKYQAYDTDYAKQVVNPANSKLVVPDVVITYGEDAVINVTLDGVNGEKITGDVLLYFNGSRVGQVVHIADGTGTFTKTGLTVGEYPVDVIYGGTFNYEGSQASAKVTVNPATVVVTVTSTTVVYPNTGSINLTASVPGTYYVNVGNMKTYEVIVEEAGVPVEVKVTDVLGVYSYDVSVTADLGPNYNPVDTGAIGTYNVVAGEASLEITVADFTYGETASATITLKTGDIPIDSKDVLVNVGGIRQTVTTNASGQATVDLSSLNAGDYRIVAEFAGDNNYPAASDNKGFRVNKALANVTVTVNNITYGEDAEVKITVTGAKGENLNGVALVNFYTEELYNVAIKNGMGSVNVSGLPANELGRLYAVQFEETENHNATVVAGGIIVYKANVTVSCDNVVVYYPAGGVITVTASVPGQYKVVVGNKEYTANIATAGGSAEVSVDTHLAVGKYDVTITGEESENYNATERTFTEFYTVLPGTVDVGIAVSDVTYPNEGKIIVTASVPGVYTVQVGDNEYTANIATAGGSAEVTVDTLDAGAYDIRINRSNIENYDDVSQVFDGGYIVNPATVVVTVTSTTVVYPNKGSINLTASVRGYYNVSIGNMKTYEIYVPEAGVPVEVEVDELLSVYTYDVSVKADLGKNYKPVDTGAIGTYNVIGVSPSLEITVGDFTYGETASATITLKQGNIPIDSKDIVVTVGGIKKTVTTNESGEATVDLSSLNAGDYHIVAMFAGDSNYPAASDEKGFRVKKAEPTVTVNAQTITYGEDAEVNITVTGVKGENLNGVARVITDTEFINVAILNGKGSVNLTGLNANEDGYLFHVEFEETENYDDKTVEFTVIVHKADVTVSCDYVTVFYPAGGVITVTASVPGEYKVVVGDKEYTANIETAGGSAEVSVATLDEGLYNITISGNESANYKAVERNFTNFYTVYPGTIEIGYAVSDVTYPNQGTITISASVAGVYTVEVGGKQYTANIETAGGFANVIVDTLNVGKYDIFITRTNIDNYDDLSKVIDDGYVVNPATAVVSCENVTVIYPDNHYVTIHSNVPGWYYVKVGEEIYEVKVGEDGTGITNRLPWGPGVYNVSVTADLGPNYNPVDTGKIGTYTVVANAITVTAEDAFVAYPGKTTIKINTNVAGAYTIKVGDKTYENVELVAGANNFEVPDVLEVGKYPVKVSADIEGYEPIVDKEIANYTVVNGEITVTGQDGSATYPNKGTIVITTDVAGNYTIKVGDKTYENVELVAGDNTFEVPDVLAVGDYPVKVSANIENYNPFVDYEIATYTVNAGTITVTGQDVTVAYPGKGNITITTNVAGAYTIKVGDKTYENIELVAGENTFEVPDVLAIGNYPVNVYANIENYYVFDDIISSYIVNAGTITVTGQDGSATYPNKGTIVITTDVAGNYTIKVGDKTYENVELAVGENTFEVPDVLAVGNYPVKVSAEIANYDPLVDKEIATYTVVKANLTIEVDPNATEIFYGDEIEFYCYFNVSDYLLDDDAVVTYYVDGQPIKGDSISVFSAGKHVVVARYTGDANFNDAESAPETFYVYKITPIIEVLPIESTYPNGKIKIVVTDDEGDEIEDITVIVSVGGVDYALETDYFGTATLNIEGIDAGTYDITAVTVEEDAYRSASNDTEQLVVKKATATVSIEDSVVVTYPETGSIQIKASVPGTYTVKVGNEEIPVVITEADKYVSVPVKLLDADVYDVSVTADLGNNYELVNTGAIATYTVNKGDIGVRSNQSLWIVNYPEKGTIVLITNTTGRFTLNVGEKSYPVDLVAGENEFTLPDSLPLGPHAVFISADIENYNPLVDDSLGTYLVSYGNITVTATDVTVTYPNKGTIVITTDVPGFYDITVGDKTYEHVQLHVGENEFEVPDVLGAGDYSVKVSANIEYYTPLVDVEIATYTVTKKTPTIDVEGDEYVMPGEAAVVTVTVKDGEEGLNGVAVVTVDGTDYTVEIKNGEGEVEISGLFPEEYAIAAKFLETENYTEAVYSGDAVIDFVMHFADFDIVITNGTYGDKLTVTVENVTNNDGESLTGTVFGGIYDEEGTLVGSLAIQVSNGRGVEQIDAPCAGILTADATFMDNDYEYSSETKKLSFIVDKAQSDIAVTYENGEFTITLDGVNGQKLNETVTVAIDGTPIDIAAKTVNGTFSFTDNSIAPGDHTVLVSFAGNKNYLGDFDNLGFKVPKGTPIVYVTGTEVEYGDPATVKVKVTDEDGNPITGTVIVVASWDVDGETQVVELNASGEGEATFVLAGLGQGNFADINATYVANDNYATAYNDTEKIKVTPSTILKLEVTANEVILGENTILTVTATDGSGAEVVLDKVNVTIGDTTVEFDVEDGKVDIGSLPVGTTEILVSYDDDFYNYAEDTVEAKVNKAVAELTVTPGNGTATIAVNDKGTGEPLSGDAYIVIDGEEGQIIPIGEDGTIEYPVNAAPGPHTVEVTFNKEGYEPVTKTVTVIVPKAETTLTIATEDTPTYGDDVTVTATITEGATGTITYYVDGSTVGTELAIGQNFVISGLSAGEHNVTAKYAGDDLYGPTESNVLKFTVAKAELVITIDSAQTYYPNTGTVEVSANNDGVYTINVNDKPYTVIIANGKGTFEVTEVLAVAEYPITWDIAESENYTGATGSAVYKVLNTEPDFSITGDSEIDYGNTNTIVPTINEDATGTITYYINGVEADTLDVKEKFVTDVLNVGPYTVTATYSGDVNYGSKTVTFDFDVLPIDVVVSVASDEVYYPNTGSINLTASAPGTYTVLVGNKSYEAVVTEANVPVTVDVEDVFEVGKYEINVTAPASQNYNAVDTGAIGTYVVSKAQSVIEVTYDPATGKATVTLEGKEDHVKLSETISFELDGTTVPGVKTTDGQYVSEDLALTPGKHSIFVVFVGNENYLGSYDQVAFEVDKFDTAEVTVSADPIKEGEDGIIKVTVKDSETGAGLSGVVTVTLDGTDYAVDVTNGEGTLTVKNLVATTTPTTSYPITAKFNGNDEYAEATGTGAIDVTDYNDVIIVISGGDENAVATLIDSDLNPINGKVNVTVDDKEPVELDVVDGKVIIPVDDEGDHDITVDFLGDDTHKPASEEATVFVGKKLIPTSMLLTVSDITYTEDEEVVVILNAEDGSKVTGKVTLTIGDLVKEVTVTNGLGQTTISGLGAGAKTIIGEFVSDGTYAGTVVSTTFNVRQMNTRIVARNMTTTAINVTEDGRIGEYFTWTLVDEKGRPLAGKAISIGFNANVYNRVTNASGQARLQINLQNSGPYTFAISFLGDDNYNGSFEVVKIDVNKQKASLTAKGATYKASAATKTLSATFKTKAGNPIVGKTIKFTVNGKTYSAKTDANGVAKVNVSLTKAGSYSVEVKAVESNTYAEIVKTVTLKLT